ncbi:hypothetical protein ACFL0Z_02295 [Patescibacteria group bacterium]
MISLKRQSRSYCLPVMGLTVVFVLLSLLISIPASAQGPTLDKIYTFHLDDKARFEQEIANYGLSYSSSTSGCLGSIAPCGFVGDGFKLGMRGGIRIDIPGEVQIGRIEAKEELKGLDRDMTIFDDYGVEGKDGYVLSVFAPWCDDTAPCDGGAEDSAAQECYEDNWGFEMKKWPAGMIGDDGVPIGFSNSMILKGVGMGITGVPDHGSASGRNSGDNAQWDPDTWYTFRVLGDAMTNNGELGMIGNPLLDAFGNELFSRPPYNPGGISYQLPNYEPKSGVHIDIGGGGDGSGIAFGGVTVKEVEVAFYSYPENELAGHYSESNHPCSDSQGNEDVDDPNNPYDTCACHGIPDVNEIPCEDVISSDDEERKVSFLDAAFPFKFVDISMSWLWELQDMMDAGGAMQEQFAPLPDMAIEFSPRAPVTGDETSALSAAMNFRSRMQNIYFGWCLVIDDVSYSMNNIVAGGQKLIEPTDPTLSWADGGCCQPITRIPEDDTDNDGMSDAWEELMFVGRSDYGYESIVDVNPNDDPDVDGYYANTFKNDNGEILTVTPYLIDSLGNVYPTGTSAARLTNVEEYILNTDPLNGDSDGDGYLDEMDFIGVGQLQMDFFIEKTAGPNGYYDVSVAAVGMNQAKKAAIVGAYQRLFVGNEGNLQIELIPSSEIVTFDDNNPVTIQAVTVGNDSNVNNVLFEWSFNGEPACDGHEPDYPELCDPGRLGKVGKNTVTLGNGGISVFDLPEPTAENYDISVIATDLGTRAQNQASLSLPYAWGVSLVTAGCAGQTEDVTTLSANSTEPVMVCVSEGDDFTGTDPNELNYIWTKDGYIDSEQSGAGKSEYALLPTKPAGENHILGVQVKIAATAEELVNAHQQFGIEGPSVEIVQPESQSSDPVNPKASFYSSVSSGEEVQLAAELSNFSSDGQEVTWIVAGNQLAQEEINGDQSSVAYTIPEDASDGDTFLVSVQASSLDRYNPEQSSAGLLLTVGELPAELGSANPFWQNLAAVFTQIPRAFQGLIVYAAIVAAIFFALAFFYPKIGRAWIKSLPAYKTWTGKYRAGKQGLRREKRLAQQLRRDRQEHQE